jgi:hypothetical protein
MPEQTYPVLDLDEVSRGIIYHPAEVTFKDFETYLGQATEIAEYINSLTLTEDNVKEVKSTLAAARKVTDALDRKRIDLKKSLLGNFSDFEIQVKKLQSVIANAENDLRDKVREMEEMERAEKEEKIAGIWDLRYPSYQLSNYMKSIDAYKRWFQPSFLNKSTSMKSIEENMVAWLEQRETDIKACMSMGDDAYLTIYILKLDLPETIKAVNEQKATEAIIQNARSDEMTTWEEPDEEDIVSAAFVVKGLAYIVLTEKLLIENGIPYKKG